MKIDRRITNYLDSLGVPYTVEPTKRHAMVRVRGRAVCTVSRDGGHSDRKAVENAIRDTRRELTRQGGNHGL